MNKVQLKTPLGLGLKTETTNADEGPPHDQI